MSKKEEDPLEAKVTFIWFQREVLAFFRAYRFTGERDWTKETPYRHGSGKYACWMQNGYAHVGQHGGFDEAILRNGRRATPEQYGPLLKELESIGYKVTPHQKGRLKLKGD